MIGAILLLMIAVVGCTAVDEARESLSATDTPSQSPSGTTVPSTQTSNQSSNQSSGQTPQQELQALASELNAKGLITQELVEDLFAKKARLDGIDPEVNDPEVAMQVLSDFNDSLRLWGGNLENVLALSQELIGEIGPQGRAGLHAPLAVSCNDVVSLNKSMDKVQKDVDVAKDAQKKMLLVDRDKNFDEFETEYRNWRTSYKNATTTANNELVKGPPAAQAGAFMAGATALGIGIIGGTAAVISAPAILTIAAVGVGTGVAVNWVWDLLTPRPKGSISQGTPLAAPLSAGESCRFVSNSSENSRPSIFSDTGLGNLHVFMEDRAPLIFENFSISSGEQVTLKIDPPALDGITVEAIASAIQDAAVTVEDIDGTETEATPEPTLSIEPTQAPTTEPLSDQGLEILTGDQIDVALERFAVVEEWEYGETNRSMIPAEGYYNFGVDHIVVGGQTDSCGGVGNCDFEGGSFSLSITSNRQPQSQDEAYFIDRHGHLCVTSAIKTEMFRGALVSISGSHTFRLEKLRENGIVIPVEKPCEGFSTEGVNTEVHRLFDSLIHELR